MEEFQEAEILWPESIQNPKSFVSYWQQVLHFTPSPSEVIISPSSSVSSNSTCTQDELHESELSWPGIGDEEWQEADVLWPDQESLKRHEFKFGWENCSVRDEGRQKTKGETTRISSPIDIPTRKRNPFVNLL